MAIYMFLHATLYKISDPSWDAWVPCRVQELRADQEVDSIA